MNRRNELKIKWKYIFFPIILIEIITFFSILMLNLLLLKLNVNHHWLWMFIFFIPFGYIQYRFYNILNYNEHYQGRMFIPIIGLKSFAPTMSFSSFKFHEFYKNNVIEIDEKNAVLLFFYLFGLLFFLFMMWKSDISYARLIRLFPKLKK